MASPLDRALTQLGVSPDYGRAQPATPKDAIDRIAQRSGVPANVLIALDEAQGGKWSVDGAEKNAQRLAQAMQGGQSVEDAIKGALGDDAASQRLLSRSYEIADALYGGSGAPAQAPDSGSDGKVSIGEGAEGLARGLGAGAVRGAGMVVDAGGIVADELVRAGAERGKDVETPLRGLGKLAGDWIKAKGDAIAEGSSEDYKEHVAGTQPGGDLFNPSTWTMGEQWSFLGLANIAAEGIGSMIPMVAAPNGPAAAVIGALMAGGEGAENAREFLKEASEAINPETGRPEIEALPAWQERISAGKTPEQALAEITREAENSSAFRQGIIGGMGGAATNRIMRGAEGWTGSGGRIARAAKKASAGALEEGAQEATEQMASASGIRDATGADIDVTEDTFGDFLGGALAGAGMGAGAGAFGPRGNRAEGFEPSADDEGAMGAMPGPDGAPQLPPPPAGLDGEVLDPEQAAGPISDPMGDVIDGTWSEVVDDYAGPPAPAHALPDGSREGVADAAQGVSPLGVASAPDAGGMGALPPPAGPIEAAVRPVVEATGQIAPPRAPTFPDQKPGSRLEVVNPATGEVTQAVFLRETPEGNAQVRIDGQTVEMAPEQFDAARDAVEPFKAAQKEAEKAIRMGQGERGGDDQVNLPTPSGQAEGDVQVNLPTPSAETEAGGAGNLPTPSGQTGAGVPRRAIRSDKALTARGREIPVEYAVVDLDSITPSQTDDGRDNPAYPQALQPRDRSGNRSQMQVDEIARDLRPELLGENPSAASGAPIVTPEGHVISGNGRTLALRKAYQGEAGARYRAFLEGQGYPVEGIERPALVRIMDTAGMSDADLAATAREANERDTASMSTSEQGMADAANIDAGALSLYRGGDIDSVANRDFVRAALPSIASPAEMGGLVRDDGSLTQDAIRRLNAALLARAYGDADLIASVLEATDGNIKAIGGALMDVAARWAQMRDAAEAGTIASQMDQTAALMEAVRLVSRARREGRKVDEFINQTDMFSGDAVSPIAKLFLGLMFRDAPNSYARPKSRDKLSAQLIVYVDEAEKTAPGADMLGHEADPAAILETIGGRDAERDDGQAGLFTARDGDTGEGAGSGRGDGSQHEIQPSEAGSGADGAGSPVAEPAEGRVTIEPIRARAAVVRGIPKDQPPKVGKVRFSWDEKAGGFVFSRKHVDAVRDALDVQETPSGDQQAPLSDAGDQQAAPKPRRPQPGDPDYTRDDAVADLHALEERRDGGIVSDARLEDRIRQQAELVRAMTAAEVDAAAAEADPDPTPAQAEAEKPSLPFSPQPKGPRRLDWWWTNNRDSRRDALDAAGIDARADGTLIDLINAISPDERARLMDVIFGPEAERIPPGAITKADGTPFKSQGAAWTAVRRAGHMQTDWQVRAIDGGYIAEPRDNNAPRPQITVPGPETPAGEADFQTASDGQDSSAQQGPEADPQAAERPTPKPAGVTASLSAEKQARLAELQARLADKIRSQTSSGLDPEFITIGAEIVGLYVEAGVRSFADTLRGFMDATGLTARQAQSAMRAAYTHVRDDMILSGEDTAGFDDHATVMQITRDMIAEEDAAQGGEGETQAEKDDTTEEPQDEPGGQENDQDAGPTDRGMDQGGVDAAGRPAADERGSGNVGRDGETGREADQGDPGSDGAELAGGVERDGPRDPLDPATEREGTSPGNFVITPDFPLGEGTAGQKIKANLAAIKLVLKLEAENRFATPAEQAVLARYVGWGGLKSVFDPKKRGASDQYGRAQAELRELLTDREYRAAARSTADAHYTSRTVVNAMWDTMRRFGFDGGRAMEPTVGTGNFIGLMPGELSGKTDWYAAELDRVTGLIAKHLYPDAVVFDGTGFQDARFRNNSVDIAIGNPPFGADTIKSDLYPEIPPLSVHNFIIAKTGMHLREGGIMGMVVTSRFLDTANPQARTYLARHFDFLGAVRLPNTAFLENAGTEVTTDVVWFQRKAESDPSGNLQWLETGVEGPNGTTINGYFAANPDMMLGRPAMDGKMYGGGAEFTLHPDGRTLEAAMAEGLAKIDARLPERTEALQDAVIAQTRTSDLAIGQSALLEDGRIILRRDDDDEGNAVIEDVDENTPWGDAALPLARAVEAVEALSRSLTPDAIEAFINASDQVGSTKVDGTGLRKSPPAGVGKVAHEAISTIYNAVTKDTPEFGRKEADALKALRKATDEKRIGPKKLETLRAILSLRNATQALLAAERRDDPKIERMRKALAAEYDAFVKKHGFINRASNDAIIGGVPGIEAALEANYKKGSPSKGIKESATPAAILRQRIITPYEAAYSAKDSVDGMHISMRERGAIDVDLIARLTKRTPAQVREDLTSGEKPMAFQDPTLEHLVPADEYLSGNLAEKIKEAEKAGLHGNARALKAAMPAPKTAEQITPSIRGLWIPDDVFKDFLRELGAPNASVRTDPKAGTMHISNVSGTPTDFGLQFRTERKDTFDIFEAAARGKTIVVYDRISRDKSVKNEIETKNAAAAVERMAAEFQKWAYMNPERQAKIVDAFNEKMNVIVERKFDGVSYLTTVGANPEIELRNSQKNGAWRMIQTPSTLLHHVVGAGKTFTAITAIMERKRMGLSRKTLVAVPNHLVTQWARDFYALYPGANILAASEKDFSLKNRRKLIARIATGDYDAIIIGHSQLRAIDNDPEQVKKIMNEQIADLQESLEAARVSGDSGRTVSQIQKRIEKYEASLDETLKKLRGEGIGFNLTDTGIDNIVVDEAQEFKNLEYSTATERLVGMNSPEGSQRALDLYIKTRSMFDAKGSVGFLTGTPVSNSLVEIYTVMKYMAPQTLRQMNLMHFDAWASAFIEAEDRFEYTPSMKLKERRVMSGLVNLGPLSTLYKTFADIVMRPQVEEMYREQIEAENAAEPDPSKHKSTRFPTPKVKGGGRRLITVPSSEAHDEFTDYLVMRTDGIRRNARDKDYAKIDNMLWVLSDARKASIDIRTIDPTMPRSPDSKVVRAGNEILRLAERWSDDRGTQMVFADSSVPTKTATKEVKAVVTDMWKKAGLAQRDATARVNADREAGRTWLEMAGEAMDAIEERVNDGALSEAQRDTIEEWMNDEGREGLATAATADSGFSFYDDLRAYLVENGMKAEEIAFIHDYPTADRKAGLFEDVNAGRVRVLIGSTFKMGAGTNAQERLVGLHHIDAPWRPSDMEQREGRIIRQGNELYAADPEGFEVEITAYATEKTADVVLWQVLERKAAGIEQFLNSTADKLTEEASSDADVYANFMAQSTGNPVFLRKMEAEKREDQIRAEQSTTQLIISEAKSFLRDAPGRLERYRETISAIDGLSFEDHGKTAGKTWSDYRKAHNEYLDRRDAHAKAEQEVRDRNERRAKGEKREPLPKFEEKAPEIFPNGKAADPWFDRIGAILTSIPGRRTEGGRVAGIPAIKIGDVTLQIEARTVGDASGRFEYSGVLKTGGDDWSLLGWGNSVTVKDPLNSRALISALSPDGIRARLDEIRNSVERNIKGIEDATPEMERKAEITVDTAPLREAERDARMYAGLVRVAEVAAAQGRIGRSNRFADMDDKGRDLALDNSDDAPVLPDDGAPSFEITSLGKTYLANFGAKGGSFNRDGVSVDQVWIKGRAEDGDVKLFLMERRTEKDDKGKTTGVTTEQVDSWDVPEEDGRERRGGGEAISAAMARRINAAAHDALARAGLLGKIGLKIGGEGRSGITGRYAKGVISILRDGAKGWRHTLDHEIIHALRDGDRWGTTHGLFSEREWRALVRAARADAGIRARVEEAYADQSAQVRAEEMVAEFYADWARNRRNLPDGALLSALRRIQSFFRAAASALRGEGFIDAQRIMLDIAEGRIGERGEVAEAQEPAQERERRDMDEPTMAERMGLTDGVLRARGFIGNLHWRKGPGLFSDMLTDAMGKHDSMNVLSLVPGRALFSELGRHIKAAQSYLHEKESMDAERNAWHSKGDAMAKRWWKLRTKDSDSNQALMDLMHASTLSGIDPSRPDAWEHPRRTYAEKHADSGTKKQRDEAQRIWSEIRDHKSTYDRLKADFDALPAEFQTLYRDVRDQYSELADAIDEALVENIKTATEISLKRAKRAYRKEMERIRDEGLEGKEREDAEAAAQDRLNTAEKRAHVSAKARQAAMRAAFESNRMKGPYFPLARFGKYFVTIRDGDGAVVSFSRFERKSQQEAFIKDAEEAGLGTIDRGVLNGDANLRDMVDPRYVAEVEEILSDAGAGADLMDAVWQHWLETLPDQSVRKNRIHRKGRAGFSTDAFRAFGKQMFHGSHQLARLKHGLKMEEMLNEAEEQAATQPDPERSGFVVQEMRRRHNFAMNPTGNPVASTLTGLGFVWYLGMSPAAAIVNMSQTTLIGTPIMAHRFKKAGVRGSVAAVSRAMRDFADGRGWSERSARLTDQERAAMAEAYRLGTIDKTQAHDLAAVAESGVEYSPMRQMVMEKIGFMFHHAERLNREVTFLANYRLARAEGMEHDAAIRDASDLTWKIHFDYQNTSRPRFMQGDVAKVLTLFRSYSVNVLWRLFRDAHQTFQGASEAERAEARAQLIGITLSMMAHAGIRGTWGFGILMMLLGMFFPGGGDDAEKFLENALLMEGDDMGTAAWNWIMGLALNGVPGGVTGVDVTQRIGMPNLWFRSSGRDLEGSDAWNEIVNDMLGPVFGIGANAFRAAGMAKQDGWRAIEAASPKFVRDGLQSYRFATEGAVTMNGDPLIESVSPRDVLVKVTGFTPAKISERYRVNNRLKNEEKRIMNQRKAIHRAVGDDIKSNGELSDKVRRRVERFNEKYPEYPITAKTIRQSVRGRAQASARNEFGVTVTPKLNRRLREGQAPMIYN